MIQLSILEHPKNKCLSQTTHFSVWWHIVFLILLIFFIWKCEDFIIGIVDNFMRCLIN